jgi:transposase InsO family protein
MSIRGAVRAWIKRYGCPIEIHSDQDWQYESDVFKEMCQLLEINKTRTTPFHPRSNGMIERVNRTVNDMLSKYIKRHQKDWDDHPDFIVMAYNAANEDTSGNVIVVFSASLPINHFIILFPLYFFKISPCTVTGGEFLDHFILNVISLSCIPI